MTSAARSISDLDPFRRRQASEVLRRFIGARDAHSVAADRMWLGTLLSQFSAHELGLVDDMGFMSQHDRDLIAQARRGSAS